MWLIHWGSFRAKVAVAFLAAGFLPVVLGGFFAQLSAERALREQAIRMHRAVLDALISGTELFVRERISRLETLATSPEVQSLDPARISRVVGTMLSEQSFLESIAVFASQGARIWNSGPESYDRASEPASATVSASDLVTTSVSDSAPASASALAPGSASFSASASTSTSTSASASASASASTSTPGGTSSSTQSSTLSPAPASALASTLASSLPTEPAPKLAPAPELPLYPGLSTAFLSALRQVYTSGSPLSIADNVGESEDRGLGLLVPVFSFGDPGRVDAILCAEARLGGADLQEILDSYPIRGNDYICILDDRGAIAARRGRGISAQAERFVIASEPREIARLGIWTGEYSNIGRTDLLSLSFSPLLAHWVAIGTPAAEAFGLARTLREHALAVGFLSLVLCGAAAAFLARSVSEPVRTLVDGLSRVSSGEFSHRVDISGQDEIGQAGSALNALAEGLQKKMAVGSIWERFRQGGTGDSPIRKG